MYDLLLALQADSVRIDLFTTGQTTLPGGGQVIGVVITDVHDEYVTVVPVEGRPRKTHIALAHIVRVAEVVR